MRQQLQVVAFKSHLLASADLTHHVYHQKKPQVTKFNNVEKTPAKPLFRTFSRIIIATLTKLQSEKTQRILLLRALKSLQKFRTPSPAPLTFWVPDIFQA